MPAPLTRSPEQAARSVTEHADNLTRAWTAVTIGADWGPACSALSRELVRAALYDVEPEPEPLNRFLGTVNALPTPLRNHLLLSLQDQATVELWRDTKSIYQLDVTLWDVLADTDPSGQIPGEVFRRLPHPNPYIAFPQPIDSLSASGDRLRVNGFWITGRRSFPSHGAVIASTHHPACDSMVLLFDGYAVDPATDGPVMVTERSATGQVFNIADAVLSRVTIPMITRPLKEHLDEAVARNSELTANSPEEVLMLQQGTIAELIRAAIITLVYLCSDDPDVGQPTAIRAKKGAPRKQSTPRVFPVGYRVGAAIRDYQRGATDRGEHEKTGRTVAPHIRRAHFHTFKVGPGRTESRVKWLSPIPVNVTGVLAEPTVHKVTMRKKG